MGCDGAAGEQVRFSLVARTRSSFLHNDHRRTPVPAPSRGNPKTRREEQKRSTFIRPLQAVLRREADRHA